MADESIDFGKNLENNGFVGCDECGSYLPYGSIENHRQLRHVGASDESKFLFR